VPSYVDSNNMSYVLPEGTDAEAYGVAPYDPTAPFGSAAAVEPAPPPAPMGGMSVMPEEQSAPAQSYAPPPPPPPTGDVEVGPIQVSEPQPQPVAQSQPLDYRTLSDVDLGLLGKERYGGRRAQAFIPEHFQNQSRVGAFDDSEMREAMANSTIDQKLALQQMGDAQLAQNNSEVLMARRREAQLDQMRADAAAKERAIKSQVDRDRAEYETMKREHMKSANDPRGAFSTVAGGLSTIFGMLAIGMASRGSRENLQATISSVHSNIDRHVQAQRAETHAKGEMADNAYARFLRTYKDADQAEAATKSLLNERAMAELDRMGAQSKDPIIQANVQQGMAQLGANLAENQAALRERSIGKTAEMWNLGQQAQSASSGGIRDMSFDRYLKTRKSLSDLRGSEADTQKTTAEAQSAMNDAKGIASKEDLKDFQKPLSELTAANDSLAKTIAAIEAIEATGEGENFGGMDDDSVTPLSARFTGAIERNLSGKAAQQANLIDGIIDAKTQEAFGSSTPEQRQTVADRLTADGSKKGTLANLRRFKEESERKIRELKSQVPAGVEAASDARRASTGASQGTVAQPGETIPGL
jgi:hypothetical protein